MAISSHATRLFIKSHAVAHLEPDSVPNSAFAAVPLELDQTLAHDVVLPLLTPSEFDSVSPSPKIVIYSAPSP